MAPHSSTLAWKIPWMEEPGGLQSMGSRRVRHDWATSLSLFTFMHWRRKWQPTPVFLPGESEGRGAWWAAVYGVAQSRTRLSDLAAAAAGLWYTPAASATLVVSVGLASERAGPHFWASLVAQIKESACNEGDLGSIPGLKRSPGGGHDNPLQYFCLQNPMDRGAGHVTVHGLTKRRYDWVTNAKRRYIMNNPNNLLWSKVK